jgi:hypothetical protein
MTNLLNKWDDSFVVFDLKVSRSQLFRFFSLLSFEFYSVNSS